ncbi:hypothetical protein JR316_0005727 [Psilocybe cubensis]|uniref:Uncharacterized protein n=2 Tax=Psilocybe cubensis TaxID=181762 RepID=A0A8H8CLM2_PSICU|nr:hypothetical protein JR316_0005727 [Psilocybe cubensis]KAH9481207.1 hypothetical protein JR316_0005727 [Psilocybe cubensis]
MDIEDSAMQMQKFNWCRIERALLALNFFGMKSVVVVVDIPSRGTIKETEVENWIMTGMNDLYSRGALRVRVVREGSTESIKTSNGQSGIVISLIPLLTTSCSAVVSKET